MWHDSKTCTFALWQFVEDVLFGPWPVDNLRLLPIFFILVFVLVLLLIPLHVLDTLSHLLVSIDTRSHLLVFVLSTPGPSLAAALTREDRLRSARGEELSGTFAANEARRNLEAGSCESFHPLVPYAST